MVLKQRPPLLLTITTAVLIVLGGTAAYLGIGQRFSPKPKLPAGVELVPGDALVALTLTTDDNQWTRLRQLGSPESQKLLDRWLVKWRDRIITANGYRFRTDIQPWIGDQITVAFLPRASDSKNATELVAIVPIADAAKAQELMTEPQDGTRTDRNYQDIAIQTITTTNGETYETTVLANKWLVIASNAKGVEAVIDSFSGNSASLATDDAYRRAFGYVHMPSAMANIYINAPVAAEVLLGSETLPGINGMVATANLLPNGLDIEATTWLGPEDQPVYRDLTNTRSSTPQRLPESTVMMLSTSGIGPMWQSLSEAEQLKTMLPISVDALTRGLKDQTGLDLENDVLPWLAGEFAVGLLPPADITDSPVPMGQLALVAEVSDREAAETTWTQLDEAMVSRFRFEVDPQQINSQPVNRLVSFYGGISMGHGWLDKDVTFFGMGPEVLSAIAPRPNKSLKANRAFQTLLDISPQESSGYFFLDVDRLNDLQGTIPFPTVPDGALFSAVKSLGITTSVKDERNLRYDIFVELPKGRRVKPLAGGSISQDLQDPVEE
ncbi:MAG: DUF3352 domain-containing protein [Cyanobacteria bacterium P01_C01_bin.118]